MYNGQNIGLTIYITYLINIQITTKIAFIFDCYSWTSMFRITCRHLSTGFAQDLVNCQSTLTTSDLATLSCLMALVLATSPSLRQ